MVSNLGIEKNTEMSKLRPPVDLLGGTFCINKRTQITNNKGEQGKKKNYLLRGREYKMETQAIPPPPPTAPLVVDTSWCNSAPVK